MNKVKLFFLVNLLLLVYISHGQNLGLNKTGAAGDPSAAFDINFTDAGLLIPRMTTTQRNAITSPANTLLIFNTTTACIEIYNSATSTWQSVFCMCTIPSAPTALAASGITGTSFTANWTASAGATTYYLDVATDAGFTSFVPGYNNLNVGNNVSYNVTGLSASTTYYYRVRASNSCGTSGNSNTISVTTTSCYTPGSQTFSYTGGVQTWTVPCGVTSVTVDVRGAQGGSISNTTACWGPGAVSASGGLGGRTQGAITVTPSEVLQIYTGGQGSTTSGGYNGGGAPASCDNPAESYGAGGGGASDIRRTPYTLSDLLAVAGGGGGAEGSTYGSGRAGGTGGGLTGGNGASEGGACLLGNGGSQVSGGAGGTETCWCLTGLTSGSGTLGNGGSAVCAPSGLCVCGCGNGTGCVTGGGGGGGYYGGGAGVSIASGGGGSSLVPGGGSTTSGYQSGNGQVIINW